MEKLQYIWFTRKKKKKKNPPKCNCQKWTFKLMFLVRRMNSVPVGYEHSCTNLLNFIKVREYSDENMKFGGTELLSKDFVEI